ncbi:lanthionine synthetase C family protein [Aquimarina longa]|uniref:lanthionine synthetase C family protein n=1 Tax=Aquimarina longa TaxID=1080221 RepID=UPI000781AD7B|nr:lanthionine synthetase C family protein [Aquimarina longa]
MDIQLQLRNKLQEISKILDTEDAENNEVGVLSGVSGIALFQFYYSKFLDDDIHADKGVESITKIVEYINDGFSYPTFCVGIAGACWALEILKEEDFVELEDDFLSSDLDPYLLEAMRGAVQEENYDFLHGAIGYGYYFLKRYENTTSEKLKKEYALYIEELILALKKSSKNDERGTWWESDLRKEKEIRGCNLSLSHGISSMINFFSRVVKHDDFRDVVQELLEQTVRYVLSCKFKDNSVTSMFPSWVVNDKETTEETSRLGWCYGDLGIGISLLRAGEVLEDPQLYEEAIIVLKHSTKRRDLEEASIMDAGLCHGAYGILLIYNFLYRKTKETVFKEASDFWAMQALTMATHEQGYAGYMAWRGAKVEEWKKEISLLEGVAGVGLSIISYLAPFDTKWEECLLIR